jgi:hypothetical protein
MDINWTTVITGGVMVSAMEGFKVIAVRYIPRALDHFEKWVKNKRNKAGEQDK